MARMIAEASRRTEDLEGDLAMLGNALVYLHLVRDRVQAAVVISQYESLLAPALVVLSQASRLVRAAQTRIHGRLPSSGARRNGSEISSEENHKIHCSGLRGLAPQKTGWIAENEERDHVA